MQLDKYQEIAKDVFSDLGVGYKESVYQDAYGVCLREEYHIRGFYAVKTKVLYKGKYPVGEQELDYLLMDDDIIIEFKAQAKLYHKDAIQLRNYMNLYQINNGVLINFPQAGDSQISAGTIDIQEGQKIPQFVILGRDENEKVRIVSVVLNNENH